MRPIHLFLAAALAAATAAATAATHAAAPSAPPAPLKAGTFTPPHPAPGFQLNGSDGKELSLARYRGKVVLLFFGFTHCPEVCPTTLAVLAQARKALGAAAAETQVVYLTVDPERDTPQRLAGYLRGFDASFIGGTGQPAALKAVFTSYGVVANKVAAAGGGYGVDHSSSVYLIDREGRLRAMMPYGHRAADYVHDVQRLLKP